MMLYIYSQTIYICNAYEQKVLKLLLHPANPLYRRGRNGKISVDLVNLWNLLYENLGMQFGKQALQF